MAGDLARRGRLDAENRVTWVYNLTAHDLEVPSYYDELKAHLIAAAQ